MDVFREKCAVYERMLDLSEEPAYEEMTAHFGKAGALFERLNTALKGETGAQGRIRNPCGKKYGWGVEHRKGTKHICNVFPEKGALVLMLLLAERRIHPAKKK